MTDLRKAAEMALDALENGKQVRACEGGTKYQPDLEDAAIEALRQALAQREQEPVAYLCENAVGYKYFRWKKPTSHYKPIALYTAPPSKPWVGLTEEERCRFVSLLNDKTVNEIFNVIEAKLKEKNK